MMPGISIRVVDDVDPEMRRDRPLQLVQDADHADVLDGRVLARSAASGRSGTMRVD